MASQNIVLSKAEPKPMVAEDTDPLRPGIQAVAVMQTSFQSSMNHPIQLEPVRLLIAMIPWAERVRFLKTGTEATQAAGRLARRTTRRTNVPDAAAVAVLDREFDPPRHPEAGR